MPTGLVPVPIGLTGLEECSESLHQEISSFWGERWQGAIIPACKLALPSMDPRAGEDEKGEVLTAVPRQASLTCTFVAGGDTGTPLAGLGEQQSPPALSARARGLAENSPSSLGHLPSDTSPVKPGINLEAAECAMDLEPHVALRPGSQQQTKGCHRRKRKF